MDSMVPNQLVANELNQTPENTLAFIAISNDDFVLISNGMNKLKNIQSSLARIIPDANRVGFPGLEREKTYPSHNLFFNFPLICYKISLSAYTATG
jgi:hypothetical protein